ncbi:MAG: cell division protein FtsA [Syntrophomonadaceae bacterium]|nr:cell division protein FtsA [Syntrophomonadaceae bacterium]
MRKNIVVALDLGSSKLSVAVGQLNKDGSITVLAINQVESAGMRRGNVVNIESLVGAIDELLDGVERISGIQIAEVTLGFSGTSLDTVINQATIAVANPNHAITGEDIERAIQAARMIPISPDRSVIHVIPRQFTVDGFEGVVDPLGMMGSRLEVEVIIVSAMTSALQNLVRTVTRSGTRVKAIAISGIMAAEAVLSPAEKEMGVALIDIGGGTSDVAIFEQGSLIFASVLPIGGDYIIRDLAVGLRTTIEEARRVMETYGDAAADMLPEARMVEIANIYGKESRQISENSIAAIIQPRVEEILGLLDMELRRAGFGGVLPAGVVFTGGTALLKGIAQVGEECIRMPIRIGYPENIGFGINQIYGPEYAALLGNLIYSGRSLKSFGGAGKERFTGGLFAKIGYWFKDLFN